MVRTTGAAVAPGEEEGCRSGVEDDVAINLVSQVSTCTYNRWSQSRTQKGEGKMGKA